MFALTYIMLPPELESPGAVGFIFGLGGVCKRRGGRRGSRILKKGCVVSC